MTDSNSQLCDQFSIYEINWHNQNAGQGVDFYAYSISI